jgi:hypothetical protein
MARSASSEIARIDAEKSKPPNLTPWASLATEVFKRTDYELPLIGGGAFSASDKKATLQALELGLRKTGVPKVASGALSEQTFYNFDDGSGALLLQLTVRKKAYAVQIERLPDGPSTVYVGRTDWNLLMATPPSTPVDGTRVGNDLEKELNEADITLGPVNRLAIGTALANDLLALGFPSTAYSIDFALGGREAGDNGNSVTVFASALANEPPSAPPELNFTLLLQSDGNFAIDISPAGGEYPNLYPVPDPQYLPYSGFMSSPFYIPYTPLSNT